MAEVWEDKALAVAPSEREEVIAWLNQHGVTGIDAVEIGNMAVNFAFQLAEKNIPLDLRAGKLFYRVGGNFLTFPIM